MIEHKGLFVPFHVQQERCSEIIWWNSEMNKENVHIGQSEYLQVDTLNILGKDWGNEQETLWKMRNGYALSSRSGLQHISQNFNM